MRRCGTESAGASAASKSAWLGAGGVGTTCTSPSDCDKTTAWTGTVDGADCNDAKRALFGRGNSAIPWPSRFGCL